MAKETVAVGCHLCGCDQAGIQAYAEESGLPAVDLVCCEA